MPLFRLLIFKKDFQFYPAKIDDLNYDSEPPVKPDADGYDPIPEPGVTQET